MEARVGSRFVAGLLLTTLICVRGLAQEGSPSGTGELPVLPRLPAMQPNGPLMPQNGPGGTAPVDARPSADLEEALEGRNGWLSGLSFEADYLFLRPYRQAMDYAIVNPGGGNVPDGTIINRQWDWVSAFRVGMGYGLPGSGWRLGFYYTYLHSAASGAVAAPTGGDLFATLTHPGTVEQVSSAEAMTSLNYNVFDIEVGRWTNPCPWVLLRPLGGVRLARIDQSFTASYNGGDANLDQVTQRLHFNGAGLRAGLDAFCPVIGGFGLFARAAGSLLGGELHSTVVETNNAGATTLTNVNDYIHSVVPVAELALGLGWQHRNLRLTAGYQFTNYFNLVYIPDFVDDAQQGKIASRTGDLSLQGLILRAEWCF